MKEDDFFILINDGYNPVIIEGAGEGIHGDGDGISTEAVIEGFDV